MRLLTCLLLLLSLSTCMSRKATPAEVPITPAPATQEWWIVNAILAPGIPAETHYLLLYTREPSPQGTFSTAFSALYHLESDTYTTHHDITDSAYTSKTGHFPLVLRQGPTELNLNRKSGLLRTPFADFGPFTWKHTNPATLQPDALQPQPLIHTLPPLTTHTQDGTQLLLHISVIREGEHLMSPQDGRALCWIDLHLYGTGNLTCLGKVAPDGSFEVLGHLQHDTLGHINPQINWSVSALREKAWTSPHSRKTYPMEFNFSDAYDAFILSPNKPDQEMQLGAKSFWMGGVTFRHLFNKEFEVGTGNMFIFKHP